MTINNKSERNYRGKCLGWPVTSYGGALVKLERDFKKDYNGHEHPCNVVYPFTDSLEYEKKR